MTSVALTPDIAAAYDVCRTITRREARNFAYGISLLPPAKRSALSAVYAFARRIDDIGDEPGEPATKLARLDQERAQLADLDTSDDPVLMALSDAVRRFPIPIGAFGELIDGVEADVRGTTYDTIEELSVYCTQVAGSVGRLSLGVFTAPDMPKASQLANTLGLALQLTNILRDVMEDLGEGRRYLPRQDLEAFGASLERPDDKLVALLRFEAQRAEQWYAEGLRLLEMLDRRSAACCGAMAGIYHRLLVRIEQQPEEVLRTRVSLPAREKLLVAARALLGGTP